MQFFYASGSKYLKLIIFTGSLCHYGASLTSQAKIHFSLTFICWSSFYSLGKKKWIDQFFSNLRPIRILEQLIMALFYAYRSRCHIPNSIYFLFFEILHFSLENLICRFYMGTGLPTYGLTVAEYF